VAYVSKANNLVAVDFNAELDVFWHDRVTGETRRVSVASDGSEANRYSSAISAPGISGDGRYVIFDSEANNLVPSDNNGTWDVFVHDSEAGSTQRVNVAADGSEANSLSKFPNISKNGRYVTFTSYADNLVPGDSNDVDDIFVRELETNMIERVNVASDGTQANAGQGSYWGHYTYSSVSANGRYVAFASLADNLVPGDKNDNEDVFVHDRETGITQRVSVSSTGVEGDRDSIFVDMSADGRFIVFYSSSSNLSLSGEGGLFLHDRVTGKTKVHDQWGFDATISDDGRHVAYSTFDNVVVYDRQTERTTQVIKTNNGDEPNGVSSLASISGNGKFVGFSSEADNLVRDDSNGASDIFVTENPHLFTLNLGLNDAWYENGTDGQGFWITVFPDLGKVALAWLTYDTVLPSANAQANLGDPGHRWMTATGKYIDNQAILRITITSAGIFDTPTEIERTDPPGSDGEIILTFDNCSSGTVEYHIPSIDKLGTIPIKRVAGDNIKYCEALNMD
jgi:archaellum component FlaF (FlaF/FlaG flagellin family)